MDLVVANYSWGAPAGSNHLPALYRNDGNNNQWLTLTPSGTNGNRDRAWVQVGGTL
jgi:hypothetical protein